MFAFSSISTAQQEQRHARQGFPYGYQVTTQRYYQICEDGKPLKGLMFDNIRTARRRLRALVEDLEVASMGWYEVRRRTRVLPRNILGVNKIYPDGSTVKVIYTIKTQEAQLAYVQSDS